MRGKNVFRSTLTVELRTWNSTLASMSLQGEKFIHDHKHAENGRLVYVHMCGKQKNI